MTKIIDLNKLGQFSRHYLDTVNQKLGKRDDNISFTQRVTNDHLKDERTFDPIFSEMQFLKQGPKMPLDEKFEKYDIPRFKMTSPKRRQGLYLS